MDKFVEETGVSTCSPPNYEAPGLVMDYYDGNTVTGLWNYAQRYAMSDNFYDTEFGPSTPGALDLISGQTFGGTALNAAGQVTSDPSVIGSPDSAGTGTVYADGDPFYDGCSNHSGPTVSMSGPNIGDLLNAKGVSWGWFEGGFAPTSTTSSGTPVCGASHTNIGGVAVTDYIPHHEPFQYYKSTANPDHTPPASLAEVGRGGQANHQYDLSWFFKALNGGNLPSVSFLKAAAYQDGHAGYSDPTDEQHFLVNTINAIQRSKFWPNTAIIVIIRRLGRLVRPRDAADRQPQLTPPTTRCSVRQGCAERRPPAPADRCGYGPRTPLLGSPTRVATRSATPPRTRHRSRASSRTTGGWAVSATSRSTPLPTRSRGCSHSGGRRRRRRSSSMPEQDESSAVSPPTIALSTSNASRWRAGCVSGMSIPESLSGGALARIDAATYNARDPVAQGTRPSRQPSRSTAHGLPADAWRTVRPPANPTPAGTKLQSCPFAAMARPGLEPGDHDCQSWVKSL